jgi:hypothetical protein
LPPSIFFPGAIVLLVGRRQGVATRFERTEGGREGVFLPPSAFFPGAIVLLLVSWRVAAGYGRTEGVREACSLAAVEMWEWGMILGLASPYVCVALG